MSFTLTFLRDLLHLFVRPLDGQISSAHKFKTKLQNAVNKTSRQTRKQPSTINSSNIFTAKETSLLVCYCLKKYIMEFIQLDNFYLCLSSPFFTGLTLTCTSYYFYKTACTSLHPSSIFRTTVIKVFFCTCLP